MLRSLAAPQSPSSLLFDTTAGDLSRRCSTRPVATSCNEQRNSSSIPKREPFSRSRIDRLMKKPSFLQRFENDLTDYCSSLEGDKSYSCWMAYFELKDLEKEMSREQVEKFVRQAGGVKSIINCLHLLTALSKKDDEKKEKHMTSNFKAEKEERFSVPDGIPKSPAEFFPVPDGIPKSQAELEEEEEAKMPDSSYTRLLRSMGRAPAWYTQAPDHETD